MKIYKLVDILYQDNGKGPYKESKVGEKYDYRRNKYYTIENNATAWGGSFLVRVDENGSFAGGGVWTTPFIKDYEEDGYYWLETANSIYKFELLKTIEEE